MKALKIVLFVLLSLLLCLSLFQVIRLLSLPYMEDGVVYNGHTYGFLPSSGSYCYFLPQSEYRVEKAIGRFDDAIIYTLKNDPDEFYLYPKVFLPHLGYKLLCRLDKMPLPGDGNTEIDYMELFIKNNENGANADGSNTLILNKDDENCIIDAFINRDDILTGQWEETRESEAYPLLIHFHRPIGLCYWTKVVKYGDDYGVLLEDGKTLIRVPNTWGRFFSVSRQTMKSQDQNR